MSSNKQTKVPYDKKFKIIILGEATVGKTSLIHKVVGKPFDPTLISTIGIDYEKRIFHIDGYNILLEIWDTAGQEKFRSLSTMHFRDANGFILVYDTTKPETFYRAKKDWLISIDSHIAEPVPLFIVGNKVDIVEKRRVTTQEGEETAFSQCANGFFETSAKTGENVQNLFSKVAETMLATWGAPKRHYEVNNDQAVKNDKVNKEFKLKKLKTKKEQTCCVTV